MENPNAGRNIQQFGICFAISKTTNKNLKSFSDRTNAGPSQGQSVGDSSISLHHLSQLLLFLKNHLQRNKARNRTKSYKPFYIAGQCCGMKKKCCETSIMFHK